MNCCVPECQTKWAPGIKIDTIFHKLPPNNENKLKWFQSLGLQAENGEITIRGKVTHALVCSNHFKASDYRFENGVKRLKPNIIPCFRSKEEKAADNSISEDPKDFEKVREKKKQSGVIRSLRPPGRPPRTILSRLLRAEINAKNATKKPGVRRPGPVLAWTGNKKKKVEAETSAIAINTESLIDPKDMVEVKKEPIDSDELLDLNKLIKEEPEDYEDTPVSFSTEELRKLQESMEIKPETGDFDIEIHENSVKEEFLDTFEQQNDHDYVRKVHSVAKTVQEDRVCTRGVQTTFTWRELPILEEENENLQDTIDMLRLQLTQLNEDHVDGENFEEFVKSMAQDEKKSQFYIKLTHKQLLDFFAAVFSARFSVEKSTNLQPIQQLALVLTRLRSGLSSLDLSYRFNIPISVCTSLFRTWISHIYDELTAQNAQKPRENTTILNCIRLNFKKAAKVSRPPHRVVKVLLASSPDGVVWFVSAPLDDATVDADLILHSGLAEVLQPDELVLPSKLFALSDNCCNKRNALKMAPFCGRGRHTLSEEQARVLDKVWRERGHVVQRVVSRLKEFRLLKRVLLTNMTDILNQVVYVCAYLLAKYA